MAEDRLDYAERLLVKHVREAADSIERKLMEMHEKLDESSGKVEKFEAYPLAGALDQYRQFAPNTPAGEKAKLETAYTASQPIREINAQRARNNALVKAKFEAMVQNAGIPTKYRRPKPRSRWGVGEWVDEEWFSGFKACIPVVDPWMMLENNYREKLIQIERWQQEVSAAEQKAKAAKEQAEAAVRMKALVMILAKKYECAEDADEVLETLLKRNKYLRLAHYLRRNRGDWNDGYEFARIGLRNFTVETDVDRAIKEEISDLADGDDCDDCDGRVFRDCTWNYDRLFGLVAPVELFSDYQELWEAMSQW